MLTNQEISATLDALGMLQSIVKERKQKYHKEITLPLSLFSDLVEAHREALLSIAGFRVATEVMHDGGL